MTRKTWGLAGSFLGLMLLAWTCVGDEPPPAEVTKTERTKTVETPSGSTKKTETTETTEAPATGTTTTNRVSPTVGGTVKSIREGVVGAGTSVKKSVIGASEGIRTSITNMGVESRVYGRLHWEKGLSGSKIETTVTKGGVATLRGTVTDARARARAVDLATNTIGVVSVVDQTTIGTPATIDTTPATTTTPGTTTNP